MITAIIIAILSARGIPAHAVDGTVYLDDRPCSATALYSDPRVGVVLVCRGGAHGDRP